jgi:hypothetical protein
MAVLLGKEGGEEGLEDENGAARAADGKVVAARTRGAGKKSQSVGVEMGPFDLCP